MDFKSAALLARFRLSDGAKLRPYQIRAAHKIFTGTPLKDKITGFYKRRDGVAVHVDIGLGKTIIGLTAIVDMFNFKVVTKPVLVIAPIKVCETVWRQEARAWSHTKHLTFELIRGNERDRAFAQSRQAHIHLINPELVAWLQTHIRAKWEDHYDALIIDESSMFKDRRSKRFKTLTNYGTRISLKDANGKPIIDPATGQRVLVPPPSFKRSAVLTGTPSPNGWMDLWSPMYIVDHGRRLHKSFETFQGRFFHKVAEVAPHVSKFDINSGEDEVRPAWQAREGAPERIHELIADTTIELNADDYGVLPQKLPPFLHYVTLPPNVMQKYKTLEREALFEILSDPIIASNGGAKSMMCWQICNGAIYTIDEYGKRSWQFVHDAKLDKLIELINDLNQNCIIAYQFTHDRERIISKFKELGIPYTYMSAKNSAQVVDRWNEGKIPNLLMHPKSAAHGLNLQFGGFTVIWFGPIWSNELWDQLNGRVARSGQTKVVNIHVIMAEQTTDVARFNSVTLKGDTQTRLRKAILQYQRDMGYDIESLPLPFDIRHYISPAPTFTPLSEIIL